ncbi:hypothetical protein BC939DRAFT_526607 [Gamsiella multidivaricata]|uniref:uncharacterized protein n=1 Tax=Gamsiella multidivaricata TaxID=101098 RepID=UPI002220B711|nr:uncharacterized protein BC939DRAFT_526607 [Gamsiella multidivaricata]KAG0366661.1 hypothetical protein BGZ54_005062 [Gamsiella multidivaricata]KAI7828852.1 hypothetical protein BC939DRAFT_526607 [Gamsiella multidivaricata]
MTQSISADPRSASDAPREYQLEVARRAMERNIIAVADTGSGKTLISVLLLKHMVANARQEAAKTGRRHKLSFFVVNKVPLVFQQEAYIASNSDIKTKAICGSMNVDNYDQATWDAIFEASETIVLTGQILLNIFQHAFLKIEDVGFELTCNLLIFDECHHAKKNHCYRQIMAIFYREAHPEHRPKIFAMTASPPKDRGPNGFSATGLEETMDSHIITPSYDEILQFTKQPKESIIWYDGLLGVAGTSNLSRVEIDGLLEAAGTNNLSRFEANALRQLRELCESDKKFKTALGAFEYAIIVLGPWCAARIWKYALLGVREEVRNGQSTQMENRLELVAAAEDIARRIQLTPLDPELNLVTDKLRKLVEILKAQRHIRKGFCAILFVERRPVAHVVYEFLRECKKFGPEFGLDFIHAAVLTGHAAQGDVSRHQMQLKGQRRVLDGFRKGHINLLVSTDVAEEGLDIDRCRLVIRFDIKNTLISHIQSRGRARDPVSEYIIMQQRGEASHLEKIKVQEEEMRLWCSGLTIDRIVNLKGSAGRGEGNSGSEDNNDNDDDDEGLEQMRELANVQTSYIVKSTGARVTFNSAIALLHQYCASLPSDAYMRPKPYFEILAAKTAGEWDCLLTLPPNAPIIDFYQASFSRKMLAKKAVAFQACTELHSIGALNDRLLPHRNKVMIESELYSSEDEEDQEKEDDVDDQDTKSKSLKRYPFRQPEFWDNKIVAPTAGASEEGAVASETIRLYMSLFTLRPQTASGSGSGSQDDLDDTRSNFRSLGLLTATAPPHIDPIELFFDGVSRWVDIVVVSKPLLLTSQQVSTLHRYCNVLYLNLYRKPIDMGTPESGMRHIIAPLKFEADILLKDERPLDQLIDWDEIGAGANHPTTVDMPDSTELVWDMLKDKVLLEKAQAGRNYFPVAIRKDLTPASPIPQGIQGTREEAQDGTIFTDFYKVKRDIAIKNSNQPLVEAVRCPSLKDLLQPDYESKTPKHSKGSAARFLIPELCSMLPVAASVLRSASWMISVLTWLDGLFRTLEFLQEFKLDIQRPLMLEALTASELGYAMNYQRLELLGDTFLKFLVTLDLYIRYPTLDEGQLTLRRTVKVSNRQLYKLARRLKLNRFIIKRQRFNAHFFAPPPDTPKSEQGQIISHKTMADLVESTLGAAYLTGGLDLGLKAAVALMGPMEGINHWEDFARSYQAMSQGRTAASATFIPDTMFGDLSHVEESIGYHFSDQRLLAEALTHATSHRPQTQCYQRLEYLGDAVLDMLVAQYWVLRYPISGPGQLHAIKSASINNQILGVICIELGLHQHIVHMSPALASDITRAVEALGDAIEDAKDTPAGEPEGEFWKDFGYTKVLGDVLESVMGAIYVDSGFQFSVITDVFERLIRPILQKHLSIETLEGHPVSVLLMRVQHDGCSELRFKNITASDSTSGLNSPTETPYEESEEDSEESEEESDSFWSTGRRTHIAINPPQEHAVMIHEQVITTAINTQSKAARREAAKKVLELMDNDPDFVARHCDCGTRKQARV